MPFRFHRRVKILPGLSLNLNKKSVSLTAGVRGAHYTVNSSGRHTASVGLPGTGLSYVTTSSGRRPRQTKARAVPLGVPSDGSHPAAAPPWSEVRGLIPAWHYLSALVAPPVAIFASRRPIQGLLNAVAFVFILLSLIGGGPPGLIAFLWAILAVHAVVVVHRSALARYDAPLEVPLEAPLAPASVLTPMPLFTEVSEITRTPDEEAADPADLAGQLAAASITIESLSTALEANGQMLEASSQQLDAMSTMVEKLSARVAALEAENARLRRERGR